MNIKKIALAGFVALGMAGFTDAQTKTLSLEDAARLGVQNSKQLKLSQNKIDQAVSKLEQSKDLALPSAKVNAAYNHALMLTNKIYFPSTDGTGPKAIKLPFDNALYMVTGSVNEPIFSGHQYKYARQSADLLVQASKLDAQRDIDDVISTIIDAYINYYRVMQNMKIIQQNLADINNKLVEIQKFENQGLATKNDVLRFQLQKSNIQLDSVELENNRRVVNYNLDILLGLPDSTTIQLQDITYKLDANNGLDGYIQLALRDRKEFGSLMYQDKIADVNIRKIHDEVLPTVSASGALYYINPTQSVFPKSGNFIAPFLLGVNINWDIASLYKNKNKVTEANLQKQAISESKEVFVDKVKMQVHEAYTKFQLQLDRIKLLQDAVTQATENERITESKYQNSLATTTDRIDAQTLLYQARLNLELAKTDATEAYYKVQRAIGHIQP